MIYVDHNLSTAVGVECLVPRYPRLRTLVITPLMGKTGVPKYLSEYMIKTAMFGTQVPIRVYNMTKTAIFGTQVHIRVDQNSYELYPGTPE